MPLDLEPLRGIIDGITPALKKFTKAAEENFYTIRNFINNLLITANLTDLNISGDIIISSDDAGGDFTYYNGGGIGGTDYPILTLYKSRGTIASPSVPNSGDTIFGYRGGGYTGTFGSTYTISAGIFGVATENFSSTAAGSKLEFYYTPNTTRTLTKGLILNQDGNLTIGTVAGTGAKSLYLLDGNFAGAVYHVASTTAKPSGNLPEGTQPTTPVEGDYWLSSARKSVRYYINALVNSAQFTFYIATATATIQNTTTETSLIGTGQGSKTLQANFFSVGKTIRVKIQGTIENTGTPTLQIKLKIGSTTILDSTALTMATIGTTRRYFEIDIEIVCRTTGATGTVAAGGKFIYYTAASTANFVELHTDGTVTIDTTASGDLDLTATWGTASANNLIRSRIATFEVLN